MKTINEVISDLFFEINNNAGQYEGQIQMLQDALIYLQKYEEFLDLSAALPDYYELLEFWHENHNVGYQKTVETVIKPACIPDVENMPLTLEELKQMEGKPIWIVNERFGWAGWEIVWNFPGNKMETRDDSWNIDEMGTEWNAYRKERENE